MRAGPSVWVTTVALASPSTALLCSPLGGCQTQSGAGAGRRRVLCSERENDGDPREERLAETQQEMAGQTHTT